jgi:hypothetical protein
MQDSAGHAELFGYCRSAVTDQRVQPRDLLIQA